MDIEKSLIEYIHFEIKKQGYNSNIAQYLVEFVNYVFEKGPDSNENMLRTLMIKIGEEVHKK